MTFNSNIYNNFEEKTEHNAIVSIDRITIFKNEAKPQFWLNFLSVEKQKIFKLKEMKGDIENCSICLANYEENEKISKPNNCFHCFHLKCLNSSISKCPQCRQPFNYLHEVEK